MGLSPKYAVTLFRWFILVLVLCGSICNCQNSIEDQIYFNFSGYNASDETTHNLKHYVEVAPNSELAVNIYNVSSEIGFLVVQAHTYGSNIQLFQNESTFINGTNIGVVQLVDVKDSLPYRFYIRAEAERNVSIMIAVVAYSDEAPIPGGCNMEFPTDIAPYQEVNYTEDLIIVDSQPPLVFGHVCVENVGVMEMYHLYLEEWDFSVEEYFSGIEKLMTVDNILKYGRKVNEPHTYSAWRRYYNSYTGTGSVFVTIAKYGNKSSAYVPAVSYGCDISKGITSCIKPTTYMWSWMLALLLFIGCFICFLGHHFLRFTLFVVGLIVGDFLIYVVLSPIVLSEGESVAVFGIMGVLFGAAWVITWNKFAKPVISVLLSFIITGFLVASILFYAGLADIHVYENDLNFWGTMCCVTLTVTLMLTFITFPGNIIACSFIGAYAVIVPIDHYIGSNLQYIIITAVRRATVANYNKAIIDPPYQEKDLYMTLLWLGLTLAGTLVQWRKNKGRAPFPPPDNHRRPVATERTPLMSQTSNVYA